MPLHGWPVKEKNWQMKLENNDPVMVGTVKIPRERIAILIGKNGSTKIKGGC